MKYLFTVITFLFCINLSAVNRTAAQTLYLQNYETEAATALISSSQSFATSWANLGSEINTQGRSVIGLYLDLTINDSNNPRVRALVKHTTGGNTYVLPIYTVGASDVKVEDHYYEFNDDVDRKMPLSWDLDRIIPYVQFQVQVSATGSTAATVNNAHYIRGWK